MTVPHQTVVMEPVISTRVAVSVMAHLAQQPVSATLLM